MHERVWGRRGPGGGIEGGPGPRTSLAHGGKRWSEGRGPPLPARAPLPVRLRRAQRSCGGGSGGALVPAPPGAGRGAGSRGAARAARVVRAPAAGRGLQLRGVPTHPRSPLPLAPLGARSPEDLAAPFRGSRAGSAAARRERSPAPWSPSGSCGHRASASRVEPWGAPQGRVSRPIAPEGGRAPLSPPLLGPDFPISEAVHLFPSPSARRHSGACALSRPHCASQFSASSARLHPSMLTGKDRPGDRARSQLLCWFPSGIWRTPKFLLPANPQCPKNTLYNSLTDEALGNFESTLKPITANTIRYLVHREEGGKGLAYENKLDSVRLIVRQ